MNITYLVRIPIWGYSGMGYESTNHLTKRCDTLEQARKIARRYTKAWTLQELEDGVIYKLPDKRWLTERESAFVRELTEHVCFSFTGPSTIVKQSVVEEVVS